LTLPPLVATLPLIMQKYTGEYLIRGHLAFKTVIILTFWIYDKFVFERKKDLCGTSVEAVQDSARKKS